MTKTLARSAHSLEVEALAKWVWDAARGEGPDVMLAVASVLDRIGLEPGPQPAPPAHDPELATARAVATDVLHGHRRDPTLGSDVWYPVYCLPPVWERTAEFKIQIGNFRFYRLGGQHS